MKHSVNKSFFVEQLLAWFDDNKRDLPWRRNKNPYHIWVSEIMLQQTQVQTVIPYFERFIASYPTIDALAAAPEEEVLKHWEGLGYYSRARNLHSAVREVQEAYDSVVPREPEHIAKLKGVGPYTAGAILSIAFNQPEPAVDGNVMRVLSRYFLIREDITKQRTRKQMEQLVRELIPHKRAGDFNEALMEIGALVCMPRNPQCSTCPMMTKCAARLAGEELALPLKKKAKPPRLEKRCVALIEGKGEYAGQFLIRQRAEKGLLARMWELPHIELTEQSLTAVMKEGSATAYLNELWKNEGFDIKTSRYFIDIEHVFSHIRWEMNVYLCTVGHERLYAEKPNYRWVTLDELDRYPFANVFLRIIEQYEQSAWIYM